MSSVLCPKLVSTVDDARNWWAWTSIPKPVATTAPLYCCWSWALVIVSSISWIHWGIQTLSWSTLQNTRWGLWSYTTPKDQQRCILTFMTCCECDVPLLCQLQEKALPLLAQEDSRISWDVAEDRFRWGIIGSGICIDRTISDCHVHKAGLIVKVSGSCRSGTIRKENNYLIELEMWTSSEEQRIWGHLVLINVISAHCPCDPMSLSHILYCTYVYNHPTPKYV